MSFRITILRMELDVIKQKNWDYLIVGTGIGGATLGLKLAQAGFSVLFVEKGLDTRQQHVFKGQFAELYEGNDRAKIFPAAGRSIQKLIDCTGNKKKPIHPFIGSGIGGSSALYGTALQRFKESDFSTWPFSYQNFLKYYDQAEILFKINKPTDYSNPDLKMLHFYLKDQSLNPYILPLAHDNKLSCGQCQSYLCANGCKNDAAKVALDPAITLFGAGLLTNCEVLNIETKNQLVREVKVRHNHEIFSVQANCFILSAGALFSPLLLLDSKSDSFPNGLGNDNRLVGRFLMRHYVDLYALKIDSAPDNPKAKEIGFDDFYMLDGEKFGTVQSFGRLPPIEVIIQSIQQDFPYFKYILPFFKPVLKKILSRRLVISSIIEDSPQLENRIWKDSGVIYLNYEISKSDKNKINYFREKLKKLFRPFGLILIKSAEKNEMLAHACGTCRMGEDPATSVVNMNNQVHGIQNLFVVDSSFFPTSGGINPGLTIAANSLRVADYLLQLESKQRPDQKNV